MASPRAISGIALVVAALGGATAAPALGWTQVTGPPGTSVDQVSLARTPDGVLHVAWPRRSGGNSFDVLHTPISPSGRVGAPSAIVTGWSDARNPALIAAPEGLRVFFGGIRTTAPNEPNQELNTATSADGGATWALQVGSVVPRDAQAYGGPVSAVALPGGSSLQTFAGTLGTWVHAGLDPAAPNRNLQTPFGPYGYDPGIAADAAGRAYVAWYSSAAARRGVLAQEVGADGSPVGGALTMPNTAGMAFGVIGRTPIVARAGGGVYVAYATGTRLNSIRLWRVGGGASVIATVPGPRASLATVAAAADGRLWVAWIGHGATGPRVLVRRSNRAATVFGATVDAGAPPRAASAYHLDGSVAGGALDVLGSFSLGTSSSAATYTQRVLPGLTIIASPARIARGRTATVRFRVLDAGDPVRGARVRVGRASGVANASGTVRLSLTGAGAALTARATAPGYTAGVTAVRVTR